MQNVCHDYTHSLISFDFQDPFTKFRFIRFCSHGSGHIQRNMLWNRGPFQAACAKLPICNLLSFYYLSVSKIFTDNLLGYYVLNFRHFDHSPVTQVCYRLILAKKFQLCTVRPKEKYVLFPVT